MNQCDNDEISSLHNAVMTGQTEIVVELLIKHNANLSHRNIEGETLLYKAAEKGYAEIAELLIINNGCVNTRTICGQSPLFIASLNEPPHDKTNKVTVRPVKTHFSLGIRPV